MRHRLELLPPLLDRVMVRITDSGFLRVGLDIESTGERIAEHSQGWWVRMAPTF